MWVALITLLISFGLLAYAADCLISGAATLARHYGVSPLLVGITIVALGTSLPEIVVALQAAFNQNPGLAIGNALGSNIANIGLVFGLCALLKPIIMHSKILDREFPFLIFTMMLITLLIIDGDFGTIDGGIILVCLLGFIAWLYSQVYFKRGQEALEQEYQEEIPQNIPVWKSLGLIGLGVVLLPISSHFIVESSTTIAKYFGISDLIIGLTLLALGTSLPEVATAIAATMKKEYDLVVGNILGSNIFNLLAVMPLPALISPSLISHRVLVRDIGFMFIMTLVLYLMITSKQAIYRVQGSLLIALYFIYIGLLYFTRNDPNIYIRVIN